MSQEPTIQLVVNKHDLLRELERVRALIGEYHGMVQRADADSAWEGDALALIKSHRRRLADSRTSLKALELAGAVTRAVLSKVKVEELSFKIDPGKPIGGNPANGGPPPADYEKLIARVNATVPKAPLALQDKIRLLLLSSLTLLRAVEGGDAARVRDAISQINLVSSTDQSQNLVREIAVIAREIYDTLNSLSDGIPALESLAESTEGISDAARKLKAVVNKLEEAAFGNLDYLETLSASVREEEAACERVLGGLRMSQHLLGELKAAHPDHAKALTAIQDRLGDEVGAGAMLLRETFKENANTYMSLTANQSFQDLTGQTLKKTINFIENLELQLVEVLKRYKPELGTGSATKSSVEMAEGATAPDPALQQKSQDEVDSMLAEMGF